MDIPKTINRLKEIFPSAKRCLELKGAPMAIFQTQSEAVWITEEGKVMVAVYDGDNGEWADNELSLEVLKLAVFEYALQANYDRLVRGVEDK